MLALLAVSTYVYFHNSASPTSTKPRSNIVAAHHWTIVAAPSSYDRWKTGPNAQTDLKTGPNAQTDLKTGPNAQTVFEPFAPNEQATWNQTPGSTIVSGRRMN